MQKKDTDEVASTLKSINKHIPPEAVPPKDKDFIDKAKNFVEKSEPKQGKFINLKTFELSEG